MLQRVETNARDLGLYREWVDGVTFADLERLAERLEGLKVGHVNATYDDHSSENFEPQMNIEFMSHSEKAATAFILNSKP